MDSVFTQSKYYSTQIDTMVSITLSTCPYFVYIRIYAVFSQFLGTVFLRKRVNYPVLPILYSVLYFDPDKFHCQSWLSSKLTASSSNIGFTYTACQPNGCDTERCHNLGCITAAHLRLIFDLWKARKEYRRLLFLHMRFAILDWERNWAVHVRR